MQKETSFLLCHIPMHTKSNGSLCLLVQRSEKDLQFLQIFSFLSLHPSKRQSGAYWQGLLVPQTPRQSRSYSQVWLRLQANWPPQHNGKKTDFSFNLDPMDPNYGGLEDHVFFNNSVIFRFRVTSKFPGHRRKKTWGTQRRSWLVLQPRHLAYPPQHFRRLLGQHLRYPVESRHFFTCTSRFYHAIYMFMTFLGQQKLEMLKSLFITFSVILSAFWMVLCDGSGFWMIFECYILWFQNDFSTIFAWFCVKKWFLGMIAWSHIDFWMVVCDEMIFDDLVRSWTDFVWWKWFWNGFGWLRNDFWVLLCGGKGFGMTFELF